MNLRLSIPAFLRRHKLVLYHVLAWMFYIGLTMIWRINRGGIKSSPIVGILLTELPSIYVFYSVLGIYFWLLEKRRYLIFVLSIPLVYTSYILFFYFVNNVLSPLVIPREDITVFSIDRFTIGGLWLFIQYAFFAFGYYLAIRSIRRERQMAAITREKLLAEQGKLQAEYAFLRAQISPHFLHNTLNFFYAKSLGSSQELSDGILTLCDILRYSFEGDDRSGMVPLTRELEQMENIIRLNQLRFSNRLAINVDISGDVEHIRIIPLVINTMVENAFKHGDLINKEVPLQIRLVVGEDGSKLFFSTLNKKKTGPKELSHGIGMDNIRKRLFAAYKKDFTLRVREEGDLYEVALEVYFAAEMTGKERNPMVN